MKTASGACRHGRLTWLAGDAPIGRCLSAFGEWAQNEIDFLAQFLGESSVVIDVGAHVGVHSIAFAKMAPAGVVYSFEPQDVLYQILLENKSACECENIRPFNCAVGREAGIGLYGSLPETGAFNAGAVSVREAPAGAESADGKQTQIRALDSLDLPALDLIKIDSEGSAKNVLEGARGILARFHPVVFLEANSVSEAWEAAELAKEFGYRIFLIGVPAFNPGNFAGSADNFLGVAHESGLVLVPPSNPEVRPPAAGHFAEVSGLDDLVASFMIIPRFGDATDHDRDPAKLRSERAELQGVVQQARGEISEQRHELDDANAKIYRLNAEVKARARATAELQATLTELAADAERERSDLQQEIGDLHGQIGDLRQETGDLQREIGELQKALVTTTQEAREQRRLARRGEMNLSTVLAHRKFLRRLGLARIFDRLPGRSLLNSYIRAIERSGLFDRKWYLENNRKLDWSDDPLVHYLLIGGFEGRNPNRLFDSEWYLRTYSDVADSGHNPLVHYVLYGANEGRASGPEFDTEAYRKIYPDVAASGANPLTQYLKEGFRKGRKPIPVRVDSPVAAIRPAVPPWSAFRTLADSDRPRERPGIVGASEPTVDVVVPIYRGLGDTLACLFSVLTAANKTSFELIVINDSSPETELATAMQTLASWGLISLIVNPKNLGFVKSVNRGLALHVDRDVVLLNSDTVVYNDWLDRLGAHARQGRVGAVTPLSNNATICSYPRVNRLNAEPHECDFQTLDKLCAVANAGQMEDIPTGIGFCMYIPRATLKEVGYFDAETFGLGYGEENDFCMRALAAGWRNVAALDVFVRHSGETSFGATAKERQREGLQRVIAKHPEYMNLVRDHAAKDPLAPARQRIDAERLAAHLGASQTILCITHVWGGGIHRHLLDKQKQMKQQAVGLVTLVPSPPMSMTVRLGELEGNLDLPNLDSLSLRGDLTELARILEILNVRAIEVHSLVGFSFEVVRLLPEIAAKLNLPYSFMVHDYVPVCPQINLIDGTGLYCGERGVEQCRRCLRNNKSKAETVHGGDGFPDHKVDIEIWRRAYWKLLKGARAVYAPSDDTAARISSYYPDIDVRASPHVEEEAKPIAPFAVNRNAKRLRVATVGAIGPHKGSKILLGCARDAKRRHLPLDFSVIGYTNLDAELKACGNVTISGRYDEEQVYSLLSEAEPQVVFLPSVWPETFSYTLTIAIATKLPIVVFDIGAPAERLRGLGMGNLLPFAMAKDPSQINDWLLNAFWANKALAPTAPEKAPA